MHQDEPPGPEPSPDETIEASFALLEVCLEQLSPLVPVETPQAVLALLPTASIPAIRLILVELIKFDMAAASEAGCARTLEFYWPAVAEVLPQECIPFDLVLEEVQLRRAAGENPRWDDYRQRFPDLADTIGKWLAGDDTSCFSGATSSVPELPIGSQFDDFFVLKQLGQGAFARVYLARQESMQRLVALKATSRGSEEPQALSQLDHANVVRVYDQREVIDPPTILLYMQYLAGGTLADCIKHARQLPREQWSGVSVLDAIDKNLLGASQSVPEQSTVRSQIAELDWPEVVAWIGIQLAQGLGYANGKGVLHRDVKPANILLSAEAIPKLADFNVSCSGLSGRAGAAAYFGGSLAYMSPEQLRVADPTESAHAEELDGRSDLYSLGIVLWELWQGKRPWTLTDIASSWTEAVKMQRDCRESQLQLEHPAVTPTERVLEKTLRSMLSVGHEQRPQSGTEAAARLRLALYPELARRFEPTPSSLPGILLSIPVLVLAALLIFGPNSTASRFNFLYNQDRMQKLESEIPGISAGFEHIAPMVNWAVFPIGGFLFLWIIWPIVKIVRAAKSGNAASAKDIGRLFAVGNRATLICAILWTVSGVIFAGYFATNFSEFDGDDAFHFFMSLVLCGGLALTYPYFGMTLLSLMIYYPKVIAPTMSDPDFEQRVEQLKWHSRMYLLAAAAIPLTAVGLLVQSSDETIRQVVVTVAIVAGLSLVAFYIAVITLEETLAQFSKVVGQQHRKMRL